MRRELAPINEGEGLSWHALRQRLQTYTDAKTKAPNGFHLSHRPQHRLGCQALGTTWLSLLSRRPQPHFGASRMHQDLVAPLGPTCPCRGTPRMVASTLDLQSPTGAHGMEPYGSPTAEATSNCNLLHRPKVRGSPKQAAHEAKQESNQKRLQHAGARFQSLGQNHPPINNKCALQTVAGREHNSTAFPHGCKYAARGKTTSK